jgi:hypothetical protein
MINYDFMSDKLSEYDDRLFKPQLNHKKSSLNQRPIMSFAFSP